MPAETHEERVERLARELANEVRAANAEDRAELRTYAADLVRTETEATGATAPRPPRRRRLGPLALAFLLLIAGGLFTVLVPPVGVVLMLGAGVATVWGLVRLAAAQGRERAGSSRGA